MPVCRIYDDGWTKGARLSSRAENWKTETMPVCRGLISFFPLVVVCRAEVWRDKHGEVEEEEENLNLLPSIDV
jgi:hypothetical protein